MCTVILDEKQFVEDGLLTLQLKTGIYDYLNRLARYYYCEGYSKRDIGRLLENFLLRYDPNINLIKWQSIINTATGKANKHPLINISGIPVTKAELNTIATAESKMQKKVLFTLLCLAKYGNAVNPNNSNWVSRKDKDIFILANVKLTTKRQCLMFNDLMTAGYIGYSKVVDNINVKVKFIDNESPEELFIINFKDLGNQYLRYCGEDYVECQCCGRLVKSSSKKPRKYCSECAKEVDRIKSAERYRSYNLIEGYPSC